MPVADPFAIRFSQRSIAGRFKDGTTVEELAVGLRTGFVKPNDLPPIRVVERAGLLFTLDNRRLEAFRQAGVPVPYVTAAPDEAHAEQWKFTTVNEGIMVEIRRPQQ